MDFFDNGELFKFVHLFLHQSLLLNWEWLDSCDKKCYNSNTQEYIILFLILAVACIYLSARKLKEPLPKNPSWFNVLGVEEDDIRDCCYRMICLYDKPKPNQEELENIVDGLRKKLDEERRAQREYSNAQNTPNQSSPGKDEIFFITVFDF